MPSIRMPGFRFIRPALAAGVSLAALAGAEAAQIEAASRVSAVTLHPDSAIIRRDLSVEIGAGVHEIVVDGLPGTLDPASLRVEGAGEQRVVVTGVDLRARSGAEREKPETQRRLRALRAERDRVADRADAVEGRKAMIQRFGQGGEGRESKPLEIEHWSRAWEMVGKGLQAANEELRALRDEIERIEAEIAALEQPMIQPRPGRAEQGRAAIVAVEAGAAGRATLSLTYRVQGAGWRPVYDARLDTRGAQPALELARRAMIRQNTGEDWSEVALTLSTLQIARATAAPSLRGERVIFHEPPPPRPTPMPMAVGRAAPGHADLAMSESAPRAATAPVEEAEARLDAGAYQSSYAVPGRTSVPSGPAEKSVRLGAGKPDVRLVVLSAPALDPRAYLEAAFSAPAEAPLLAGEVMLTRDGAFIGRGRLPFVAPGETTKLGFGADERVTVTRVPLGRMAREPGLLGSTRSEEFRFRIQVRNLHGFAIPVRIEDRVPVSEDQAIQIERLAEMTKPDLEAPEDRRGVVAWTAQLKPQEERGFVTAYRIRWPAGKETRITPLPR